MGTEVELTTPPAPSSRLTANESEVDEPLANGVYFTTLPATTSA